MNCVPRAPVVVGGPWRSSSSLVFAASPGNPAGRVVVASSNRMAGLAGGARGPYPTSSIRWMSAPAAAGGPSSRVSRDYPAADGPPDVASTAASESLISASVPLRCPVPAPKLPSEWTEYDAPPLSTVGSAVLVLSPSSA